LRSQIKRCDDKKNGLRPEKIHWKAIIYRIENALTT
jgi:hypothetical protein